MSFEWNEFWEKLVRQMRYSISEDEWRTLNKEYKRLCASGQHSALTDGRFVHVLVHSASAHPSAVSELSEALVKANLHSEESRQRAYFVESEHRAMMFALHSGNPAQVAKAERFLAELERKRKEDMRDMMRELFEEYFVPLSRRVDALSLQVTSLSVRMDAVEARLGRVEARLGRVEARLNHAEARLNHAGL